MASVRTFGDNAGGQTEVEKKLMSRESGEEDQAHVLDREPTQLALCLRLATTYKVRAGYALLPSMTRLHNAELVYLECGLMNPLLCPRHHRQVKQAVKT
jgi:hypothetical protein